MDREFTSPHQPVAQELPIGATDPKPGHVERHAEEFLFTLERYGGVWFDKHDGRCAEIRGIEPGITRIEVHQDHGPINDFAVHIRVLARPPVDQPAGHSAIRQCRSLDQIGPQAVQFQLFAACFYTQKPALVHWDRDIVLVHGDIVETNRVKALLHVFRRLVGSGIARDPGAQIGKIVHGLLHPPDRNRLRQFLKVHSRAGRRRSSQH